MENQAPESDSDKENICDCWINDVRKCGADCVAFDQRAFSDQKVRPCTLLNIGLGLVQAVRNLSQVRQPSAAPSGVGPDPYKRDRG